MTNLTEDQQYICQTYMSGLSIRKTAKHTNCSYKKVRRSLRLGKIPVRKPKYGNTNGKKLLLNEDVLCSLFHQGLSNPKIAKHFNVTRVTIARRLRCLGLRGRSRPVGRTLNAHKVMCILTEWRSPDRRSTEEIAIHYNVSNATIFDVVRGCTWSKITGLPPVPRKKVLKEIL